MQLKFIDILFEDDQGHRYRRLRGGTWLKKPINKGFIPCSEEESEKLESEFSFWSDNCVIGEEESYPGENAEVIWAHEQWERR